MLNFLTTQITISKVLKLQLKNYYLKYQPGFGKTLFILFAK